MEKTAIQCSDGRCIPVCKGNRDYDELVAKNITVFEYATTSTENPAFLEAQLALAKSDITILRCVERGVAIPEEWVVYRVALRKIISEKLTDSLPLMPAYPEGS
jgi:hypothetical protein